MNKKLERRPDRNRYVNERVYENVEIRGFDGHHNKILVKVVHGKYNRFYTIPEICKFDECNTPYGILRKRIQKLRNKEGKNITLWQCITSEYNTRVMNEIPRDERDMNAQFVKRQLFIDVMSLLPIGSLSGGVK